MTYLADERKKPQAYPIHRFVARGQGFHATIAEVLGCQAGPPIFFIMVYISLIELRNVHHVLWMDGWIYEKLHEDRISMSIQWQDCTP